MTGTVGITGATGNAVYEITGPGTYSMAEVASLISEASGRSVTFQDETLEEARESRRPTGAPD